MRRAPLCLLLTLLVCGCSAPADAVREKLPGGADDPALAARRFLQLVRLGRCPAVFTRFSAETQRQITLRSKAEIRKAPYYAEVFSPENLMCKGTMLNRYFSYVASTAEHTGTSGDTALITVMLREGTDFLIPGFFPTSHKDTPVTMKLVHEAGAWRVAVPGLYEAPPGGEPIEIGEYLVQVRATDATLASLEIRGPADQPARAVRHVVMDFERWAALLPGTVIEARALEPPRPYGYQLVYVRLRARSGEEADFVVDLHHGSGSLAARIAQPDSNATARDSAAVAQRNRWLADPPFFRLGWRIAEPDSFPRTPGVARIGRFTGSFQVEDTRQPPEVEWSFTTRIGDWPAGFRAAFAPREAARNLISVLDRIRFETGR